MTLNQAKGYIAIGFGLFLIYLYMGVSVGFEVTTLGYAIGGLFIYGFAQIYKD